MNDRSELKQGEPHPAASEALAWIYSQDLAIWIEAFASLAIEGNRLAKVCSGTLNRIIKSEPVSDRYVLGLAWTMRCDADGNLRK